MFSVLCRRASHKNTIILTNFHNLCYFQIQQSLTFCSISQNQPSPTLSYLTNKCGVPLDFAVKVSKKIQIDSAERPDSVLQLLKNYDFTEPQILNVILKYPFVLVADPVKTIKPKFEFFESLGLSKSDIAKIVSSYQRILYRSLTNQILPTYAFLKRYMNIDKDIVTALIQIQCGFVTSKDFHLVAESNIEILRNHRVPDSNIGKLLMTLPRVLTLKNDRFEEIVGFVERMRLDPSTQPFVRAVGILGKIGKSGWQNKAEAYKKFGWTEGDVLSAFKIQPKCMETSEKKIGKMMDFFMRELGMSKYDIVKYPNLVNLSLEKTIIPRCSVLQVLVSNGLFQKGSKLMWAFHSSKKKFERAYMQKYQEKAPDVLNAYKGELGYPKVEMLRGIP